MLLDKFLKTIRKYNLININDKILIAVSGGPDSVALLFLLYTLKDKLNLTLHVAHLDHRLRKDSYKDREFVEDLARRLKLNCVIGTVEIKKIAQKGSIEEIARQERFNFLFKTAENLGIKKIALGHNRDDQVETVLMRFLRGAGLYGLQGILPKRIINGFTIIRPLINISRKDINIYLKKIGIQPKMDPTNLKDVFFRNKIRNRLLPMLEKEYNPNIREIIFSMSENIGTDYDFIEKQAKRIFKKIKIKSNLSRVELNLKNLTNCHLAIQRMVLRMALKELKGDMRRFTFKHFKELEELIYNRPEGSIVDLPANISCQKKKNILYFRLD